MGNSNRVEGYTNPGRARRISPLAFAGRFFFTTICLVLAVMMSYGHAAAQNAPGAAPSSGAGTAIESQVQLVQPSGPGGTTPPITVTLQDALERARKLDSQYLGAISDAKSAKEDRLQARNAMLPTVTATTQYLGTQGNSVRAEGRFVTNDGVHVYRAWGVLHTDLSPALLMGTGYNRAKAAEALANAKMEIARRGLTVTVSKFFYTLAVAQRKYGTAQEALDRSKAFLDITQSGERQGQLPHSDELKAEIQYRIQRQAFEEARLAMETARLDLAVTMFPTLNENFSVVDDLDSAQAVPPFPDVQAMAEKENPDLRVAMETLRQAKYDVTTAKTAFLPTLTIDTDYGIEANSFALRSKVNADPNPNPALYPDGRLPNLGYFVTAVLNIPVWDWGTLRSKLHQAQYKQETAKAQLSQVQRQKLGELYAAYNEVVFARSAVEETRHTAELAAESLRLTNIRYQGGASPAIEVVDAETSLVAARNAYIDAQARFRAALATLQTHTGTF